MSDLPFEILNTIFLNLDLNQKFECLEVSRQWRNVLLNGCLLETVDVSSLVSCGNFLHFLQKYPQQRTKVRHLVLMCNVATESQLLDLFLPNIETVCIKSAMFWSDLYEPRYPPNMYGLEQLRSTITSIVDVEYCSYTFEVLNSGACQRLVSLTLNLPDGFRMDLDTNDWHEEFDATKIVVSLLENAPNLLYLTIYHCCFDVDTLELLHTHLNRLETLVLSSVKIIIATHLPENIAPSPTLKKVSLGIADVDVERQIVFIEYVQRKYTQLASFDLYEPHADEWTGENTSRLTSAGIVPLIQNHGQHLTSLRLESLNDEPNLFLTMDQLDYKLNSFSVDTLWGNNPFRIITASNQCRFLQELSLKNYDIFSGDDLESPDAPFEHLNKFVSLRKLTLSYYQSFVGYRTTVNLNNLLDSCPNTLESLVLEDATLEFNQSITQSQDQYNLCKLQLHAADIPHRFGSFLSQYCQKLTHLKLTGYEPFVTEIFIPTIHLECFYITSPTNKDALDLSVTTLADERQRYYSMHHTYDWEKFMDQLIDEHGTSVCNTVSSVPVPTYPPFTLVCASVKTLIVNHFLAR